MPRAVETQFKGRSRQRPRRSGRPLTSLASRLLGSQGAHKASVKAAGSGGMREGAGHQRTVRSRGRASCPPGAQEHRASAPNSGFLGGGGDAAWWGPGKQAEGPGALQAARRWEPGFGAPPAQEEQIPGFLCVRAHSETQRFNTAQARALTRSAAVAGAVEEARLEPGS